MIHMRRLCFFYRSQLMLDIGIIKAVINGIYEQKVDYLYIKHFLHICVICNCINFYFNCTFLILFNISYIDLIIYFNLLNLLLIL